MLMSPWDKAYICAITFINVNHWLGCIPLFANSQVPIQADYSLGLLLVNNNQFRIDKLRTYHIQITPSLQNHSTKTMAELGPHYNPVTPLDGKTIIFFKFYIDDLEESLLGISHIFLTFFSLSQPKLKCTKKPLPPLRPWPYLPLENF